MAKQDHKAMDACPAERPSSLMRISRSFVFRFSLMFRRNSRAGKSSKSSPISRLFSPRETPSSSASSPMLDSPATMNGGNGTAGTTLLLPSAAHYKPLLRQEELKMVSQTLNKALKEVDFGNEIVIRLLNDKRSLFKSLLARCAPQAHEIEVFDVQSLARFCPRAVQVGDGVTRFFERVAILLEQANISCAELEDRLCEMCRSNGQLHYRMKVWFQAENWLCVKHSVVDTVLMANSNLKRGKQLRSANDLYGLPQQRKCLNRFETLDNNNSSGGGGGGGSKQSMEVLWMRLMQAVIAWMKQGFLEAAISGREEQDEQL